MTTGMSGGAAVMCASVHEYAPDSRTVLGVIVPHDGGLV
jgi:hypothetical protein